MHWGAEVDIQVYLIYLLKVAKLLYLLWLVVLKDFDSSPDTSDENIIYWQCDMIDDSSFLTISHNLEFCW